MLFVNTQLITLRKGGGYRALILELNWGNAPIILKFVIICKFVLNIAVLKTGVSSKHNNAIDT